MTIAAFIAGFVCGAAALLVYSTGVCQKIMRRPR